MLSLGTKVWATWFILVLLLKSPLQSILVQKRRCSGHWLVQYGAMAAYYLPTVLTFYAANAVYSTSKSCEYTPGLAAATESLLCFTIYFSSPLGSSHLTQMRVYSLCDGPLDRWRFVQWVVFIGCIEWKWWSRIPGMINRGLMTFLYEYMGTHFFIVLFILFDKSPESTMDCQTKAVADYMKRESILFGDDDVNSSLQLDSCRYPFMQRNDGQWISMEDMFHKYDLPDWNKDICLSYSLSRLLARRYYGFHCTEEGDEKVRRFVLSDLERRTYDYYKRAFTIVEVQLAFLHDYFFTNALQMIELQDIRTYSCQLSEALFTFGIMLSLIGVDEDPYDTAFGRIRERIINSLIWFMVTRHAYCVIMKPGQIPLPIYWTPIDIAFRQVNHIKPNIFARFFRVINCSRLNDEQDVHPVETQTSSVYWSNQIAQYSILHDYDHRRPWRKEFVAWFQGHVLSQPSYSFIKHLPIQEEDVRVPDSVRKLVADTLQGINGPPTNGTRSLKINRASAGYDWSWTCRQQTHTHTILIWHIATCYCEMSPPHSYRPDGFPRLVEIDTWYEIATALSRYCAYLVAFLPEFLPEHSLITKEVFQNVILVAQHALGSTHMEEKEKHTKIRQLKLLPRSKQTTFHKGVRLGRQLEKLNTRLRWKVMAEFWAETILYVAPSDNAEAHIEHLAKGGEFITHLWAMLSNAGILKRAEGEWQLPAVAASEEPPTHQLPEAMSYSNDGVSTSSRPSRPIQTSEPPPNEKGKQPQIM